jgi:hypothetical protein
MNTYLNQIVSDDNFKPVKAKFQEGLLFGTVTLPDGVVLTLEENAILPTQNRALQALRQ